MSTELVVYTETSGETLQTKYHNQKLFDYTRDEVDRCIERLVEQAEIYRYSSSRACVQMATRGLFAAALTLNATAVWTAKRLEAGRFAMSTQSRFFFKRWRLSPDRWGANAKSCLARSWSGYSIGADAVCIDRHLARLGVQPPDAVSQWRTWFDLYESMYGPGETTLCVRWHEQVLDWIAFRGDRPRTWK
jgi:hypothetical protein